MNDMMLLVEPLIPALRRYARALLRDRAAADDLVQDCLERTITRWHQRRQDGDARSWVFTILHNLAINRLRQTARRGRQVELDDAGPAAITCPANQEDRLIYQDLLQALGALPDEQRTVLLLVSVEDLPYADVARILAVPVGTVMSRLSRAREKLQRLLNAGEPGSARAPMLRRIK